MRVLLIGRESYHVLCDKLPIPFPFGKDGEQSPTITSKNGEVTLIRDSDFHYGRDRIITLSRLKSEIEEKSKLNWRSDEYKKVYIGFYKDLIKLMVAYQRESTIDDVLREEIDYNNWYC